MTPVAPIVRPSRSVSDEGHDDPPRWLCLLAFGLAAAVLAFGWFGLLLAVNGWYRTFLALPLGALATVGLIALVRRALAEGPPSSRRAHVVAAVAVAAILAITLWNSAHASQHVLIDRDGGSYLNTGRWIARTGGLDVHPRVGGFANEPTLGFRSPAVYDMSDGSLQFQFAHFLPALLAEAHDVGGDLLMFHLVEPLSGVALLAFFVLAWRLLRHPWFALAAVLALAFVVPQVSFSRDSYSEIPSQILLFTAIWLLTNDRLLSKWNIALTAGLLLGATEATRIDALALLVGLPALVAVAWLVADRDGTDRRAVRRGAAAFIGGLVPGLALGYVDLTRHAGGYVVLLSTEVRQLVIAIAGAAIVTLVVVFAWPWILRHARPQRTRRLAAGASAAVLAIGFGAWAFRPWVNRMHGADQIGIHYMQQAEGQVINGTRYYYEYSLTWMSWYLGPIALACAIIGAALLLRGLILGRFRRTVPAVTLLAFETLLYLWRASAIPDHVWIDRRFLAATIPALILLAFGLAAAGAARRGRGRGVVLTRAVCIGIAVVSVAYPIYTVAPIASMSEERGYVLPVRDLCRLIGPHAAVIILSATKTDHLALDLRAPQPLRGWCGAEVASLRSPPVASTLRRISSNWSAAGRNLFVVAQSSDTIHAVLPGVPISSTRIASNPKRLEQTLTRRPDRYVRQTFSMVVAPVPTDG